MPSSDGMTHRRSPASRPPPSPPPPLPPPRDKSTSKAAMLAQRRKQRRRRPGSLSKTTILVCVGLAEIGIYYLYRWGDSYPTISLLEDSVGSMADGFVKEWLRGDAGQQPLLSTGNTTSETTDDQIFIDMEVTLRRTSTALGYGDHFFDRLHVPPRDDATFYQYSSKQEMGVNYTMDVLRRMGVNHSDLIQRGLLDAIPPWWQVVENYGKEPIILGLERCQTFRERVHLRHVAPAGLFSTGTNLLAQMLYDNCIPAKPGQRPRIFNMHQVPWGKHNPASARLFHIAKYFEARNQSAVLPVVAVRHPYSWLYALCVYPYALVWTHRQRYCDRSLFLNNPVQANFAALRRKRLGHIAGAMNAPSTTNSASNSNSTKTTTSSSSTRTGNHTYDSLIHLWRDWNLEYFQQTEYPMLMVRFEDLVFRPEQVVEKVCHCVGGKLHSEQGGGGAGGNDKEPFWYLQENANLGSGHGTRRSDLVSAVIRYGQPLDLYHRLYSPLDWTVIRKVLDDDDGLTQAFGYKLKTQE